jgi:hypothetical protein
VAACVADVAAVETALDPALLQGHEADISSAPVVVLDGNLSHGALQVHVLERYKWRLPGLLAGYLRSVQFAACSLFKIYYLLCAMCSLLFVQTFFFLCFVQYAACSLVETLPVLCNVQPAPCSRFHICSVQCAACSLFETSFCCLQCAACSLFGTSFYRAASAAPQQSC